MGVLTLGNSVDPPHEGETDDIKVPNAHFGQGG